MSTDKFIPLAEKRTDSALKSINLIGNLANPPQHDYTDDQVKRKLNAMTAVIVATKNKFELASTQSFEVSFSL